MSLFDADNVVIPSPRRDGPDQILHINGMGGDLTMAHNLVDEQGRPAVPSEYRILGFSGVNTFLIKAMDATTITVRVTEGGSVDLALYL